MKKILVLAAFLLVFGAYAQAADKPALPLVGEYTNDAGYIVIAPAPKAEGNYAVGIESKDGKCSLQIVAGTWKDSEQTTPVSKETHPNTIVAVKGEKYNKFTLWPVDETIQLSEDALPFDEEPACKVFQNNLTFTRKAASK